MKESMYSIKDMEVLSGIKAHTIRIWEKRYNLLNPVRTDTNIRLYNDEDLRKILNVAMLVKHGVRISKVSEWGNEKIREEVLLLDKKTQTSSDFVERLILGTVNFDETQINSTLDDAVAQMGFEQAFSDIVIPFFEQVGIYWQVGSIFPAQEHYFSNLVRKKLITETERLSSEKKYNELILFFLHEEERHELGMLFYHMIAVGEGYETIYLGQNVPLEDLKSLQQKRKVDLVFTAFLNSIEKEELEDYLNELSAVFPGKRVFVTGRQVQQLEPNLPRKFKTVSSVKEFKRYLGR